MRENMGLYHGKRVDNDKWVDGYFFETNTPVYRAFIIMDMAVDITDGCTDILDFNIVEVDPETVGEFTGLTDKNGNRIFEGDIVKADLKPRSVFPDSYVVGKVVFVNGTFKISVYIGSNRKTYKEYTDKNVNAYSIEHNFIERGYQLEIIGNIHDNPELLKGGENND